MRVAVEAVDGAGKATFADELVDELRGPGVAGPRLGRPPLG
ncbi:MAG: hypothetical protein FWJ70_04875 [Micromonosporaceae bacterium]